MMVVMFSPSTHVLHTQKRFKIKMNAEPITQSPWYPVSMHRLRVAKKGYGHDRNAAGNYTYAIVGCYGLQNVYHLYFGKSFDNTEIRTFSKIVAARQNAVMIYDSIPYLRMYKRFYCLYTPVVCHCLVVVLKTICLSFRTGA